MKAIFETRFAKVGEASEHYCTSISSTHDAKVWAKYSLNDYFAERLDQEEFLIATLDTKNKVRRVVRITRGTLDSSLVHPREVFRPAIVDAASAILLIHNHPSGDPAPSEADVTITKRLNDVAVIIGIRILDHIIVGNNSVVSLKEIGLFK
jgi:DNA repair protein RadC